MARTSKVQSLWIDDEDQPPPRGCDMPGCADHGVHPAPKSRDQLRDYFWFCLDHVRAYNAAWNYYEGMDQAAIERHIRQDTTWQRPTWPLGDGRMSQDGQKNDNAARQAFNKFYATFAEDDMPGGAQRRFRTAEDIERARWRQIGAEAEQALAVMEVTPPVTADELKAQYKRLVKRHHPDANGGDKAAEDRLKAVNQAYATLKTLVSALTS